MVLIEAQISGLPCICSTEIPVEVKGIPEFEFVSLDDNFKVWADYILKFKNNTNRISYKKEFANKGYDITKEAKKLEKIYLKLLKG